MVPRLTAQMKKRLEPDGTLGGRTTQRVRSTSSTRAVIIRGCCARPQWSESDDTSSARSAEIRACQRKAPTSLCGTRESCPRRGCMCSRCSRTPTNSHAGGGRRASPRRPSSSMLASVGGIGSRCSHRRATPSGSAVSSARSMRRRGSCTRSGGRIPIPTTGRTSSSSRSAIRATRRRSWSSTDPSQPRPGGPLHEEGWSDCLDRLEEVVNARDDSDRFVQGHSTMGVPNRELDDIAGVLDAIEGDEWR